MSESYAMEIYEFQKVTKVKKCLELLQKWSQLIPQLEPVGAWAELGRKSNCPEDVQSN